MTSKKDLATFGRPAAPAPVEPPKAGKAARGTAARVSIPVRVSQADWHELGDFARQQHSSMNQLFIEAMKDYMTMKGVRPIRGE